MRSLSMRNRNGTKTRCAIYWIVCDRTKQHAIALTPSSSLSLSRPVSNGSLNLTASSKLPAGELSLKGSPFRSSAMIETVACDVRNKSSFTSHLLIGQTILFDQWNVLYYNKIDCLCHKRHPASSASQSENGFSALTTGLVSYLSFPFSSVYSWILPYLFSVL